MFNWLSSFIIIKIPQQGSHFGLVQPSYLTSWKSIVIQSRKGNVQVSVPWVSLGPGFHHISGNSDQSDFSHCQYTHACKNTYNCRICGILFVLMWHITMRFTQCFPCSGKLRLSLPDQVIHDESNPSWSHPDLPPYWERSKTVVSLSDRL